MKIIICDDEKYICDDLKKRLTSIITVWMF